RLIIRCGQHSLQVFCLGVLLAVLAQILLTAVRDDIAMQLAISVGGIALMLGVGSLLAWYKADNALPPKKAGTNAAQAVRSERGIAGLLRPAAWRTVHRKFSSPPDCRAAACSTVRFGTSVHSLDCRCLVRTPQRRMRMR